MLSPFSKDLQKAEKLKTVGHELYQLILELQDINELSGFALAGGTSLAVRYNHRISIDIDLFSNKIIGQEGFKKISLKLKKHFGSSLKFCEVINTESGNQYCFLRSLIAKEGKDIKVELVQNIQLVAPIENYNGIRIISIKDIGILKLLSASSRKAKKDIYDLDLITEELSLESLLDELVIKERTFNQDIHKNLFDLDNDPSPSKDISLLLEFDNIDYTSLPFRPSHSNDRIDLISSSKSWTLAKASWRRKVKNLMRSRGISLPKIRPIN